MKRELQQWKKANQNNNKIDINTEGLEAALEAGKEDYERRQFELEVMVFTHLVASIVHKRPAHLANKEKKCSVTRLFKILNTSVYQRMFKVAMKKCGTDEVPSEYMENLYRKFLAWQKLHENSVLEEPELKLIDGRKELKET